MSHQSQKFTFHVALRAAVTALVFVFAMTVVAVPAAQAQTYKVIHDFTGGQDGWGPAAGFTMDKAGNFYGTTTRGGYMGGECTSYGGCGTVFRLSHRGSGWVLSPLYAFQGGEDGIGPQSRVIFGPDGRLYGNTALGGSHGSGTAFSLRPPAASCRAAFCPWNEAVLFAFDDSVAGPPTGDLVSDASGNLYGATWQGGLGCGVFTCGAVYELTPAGGSWTLNVIHNFSLSDGYHPSSGLIFDQSGNLYGTTGSGPSGGCGGLGCGTVYQLSPSQSGWTENILYAFQDGRAGVDPAGGLIFDTAGNLYGTTVGGQGRDGSYPIVFELSPSNGGWTFSVLYELPGNDGPNRSLAMDAAGNLYGVTGSSLLFKLAPGAGGWTYTDLHNFTGGSDGGNPNTSVTIDASGNLFGTASSGGKYGYGVVWEITP